MRKTPTKGHLAYLEVCRFCKSKGLPKPKPEHLFAKDTHGRNWRFDCAWIEYRLALEFQGSVWTGGGHTSGSGYTKDCEKYSHAAILRWHVMPVTYGQLKSGQVFLWLQEFFSERDKKNESKENTNETRRSVRTFSGGNRPIAEEGSSDTNQRTEQVDNGTN